MKQKIVCPKCQGPLKVWVDVDASLFFNVSPTGKLSQRTVVDNMQSDGRCGLKCQNCDWLVHGEDGIEDEALLQVINKANDAWDGLELKVVKRTSNHVPV